MKKLEELRLDAVKGVLWDYNIQPEEALRLITGEAVEVHGMHRREMFIKILNNYSWHKVRQIIPAKMLPEILSDNIINALFPKSLRDKYRYVRALL